MPYIPNSREDQKKMLDAIGVSRIEDLFTPIPDNLRLKQPLPLPAPLAEAELVRHLEALAFKNRPGCVSFAGGGLYDHFIPAAVWNLAGRPEFSTAYTPYQAEVAQGTLQTIYEFQTHVCRLTGMDVANASLYDGGTATAEAAMLAVAHTGRRRIVVSETVNPMFREVLATMAAARDTEIVVLPSVEGVTSAEALKRAVSDQAACLILAQPNFFGMLEELETAEKAIHAAGGLFIMVFDPISLGILKTPAEYNADVAVAEGQSLGIPRNFGGPLLGIFACRQEFVRKIPGRLVGRTVDADGKTGFVLTLQTREQHIRREKATSNICTNEALCATAATIYMSLMGKQGLPRVARLATERAHYLAEKIAALDKYAVVTNRPFFKEFVVETPRPAKDIIATLGRSGIVAGIDLGRWYPAMERRLLVAVTEMVSVADCDTYAALLAQAAG
jgi:glycine dehydrogenase subunit 1